MCFEILIHDRFRHIWVSSDEFVFLKATQDMISPVEVVSPVESQIE